MSKKILVAVSAVASVLCSALLADTSSKNQDVKSELYPGGFTLGLTWSHEDGGWENFLTWGYIGKRFMFNLGANYERWHIASNNRKANTFTFLGQLGLRNRLHNNLFISYGASGVVESRELPKRRYGVGAFLGLDLQITRHFLLSGKIDPFCFAHQQNGNKFYQVFEAGSLSLAYVF